jgi:hypothetical protein
MDLHNFPKGTDLWKRAIVDTKEFHTAFKILGVAYDSGLKQKDERVNLLTLESVESFFRRPGVIPSYS